MNRINLTEQDLMPLHLNYIPKNELNNISDDVNLIYLQSRHSIATLLSVNNIRELINELSVLQNYEDLSYIHILHNTEDNVNIIKNVLNYQTYNI